MAALAFPPPALRRGLVATSISGSSVVDFARIALAVSQEHTLRGAIELVQREAIRLTGSQHALVVIIDWARLACWTLAGPISDPAVHDLVTEVAGTGNGRVVADAALEPIGRAPTRAVIAVRRSKDRYTESDVAALSALARGVAPAFDRFAIR